MDGTMNRHGSTVTLLIATVTLVLCGSALAAAARAATAVNHGTHADQAAAKYGATGKGVLVAILDRGIDYAHPDFRNANGTTRIKSMLDQSGESLCSSSNPAPVEYP